MNILEMTDDEIYELGMKALISKLGDVKAQWFIRQCQPGTGDYSVDRHQLLAGLPDIATIAKHIQERKSTWGAEERARARRFAASQSEIQKMTDIEIYEIGARVLTKTLGVAGSMNFLRQCQELNGGYPLDRIENREEAEENIKCYTSLLRLNPKIVENYIRRGNAYSYIGEHAKAIADYNTAIEFNQSPRKLITDGVWLTPKILSIPKPSLTIMRLSNAMPNMPMPIAAVAKRGNTLKNRKKPTPI